MVNGLIRHAAKWTAPSPLWTADLPAGMSARNGSPWQPAILRFDNDLFMEEALALLAYHPEQLAERIARPETWTKPMKRAATISRAEAMEPISEFSKTIRRQADRNALPENALVKVSGTAVSEIDGAAADELPFKLYQPAHQRFYLVAASLVCQQASMPDRRIDAGKREAVGFVLRRVSYAVPDEESKKAYDAADDDWSEYAYTATADGFAWKLIPSLERTQVQTGEERLPLFAMHFSERDGHRRRMLAGLIPVGRREEYLSAPQSSDGGQAEGTAGEQQESMDPRRLLFEAKVIAPWTALLQQAALSRNGNIDAQSTFEGIEMPDDASTKQAGERTKILDAFRNQIQMISWYTLLDFAGYLEEYLNPLWQVITGEKGFGELNNEAKNLYEKLDEISVDYSLIKKFHLSDQTTDYYNDKKPLKNLIDALKAIVAFKDFLEKTTSDYEGESLAAGAEWPGFTFPLTDPGFAHLYEGPVPDFPVDKTGLEDWEVAADKIGELGGLVGKALETASGPLPDLQSPQPPLNAGDGWFVIRCLYERPNCGPLNPAVLSAPTEKFLMAPFFDPDAPARPVRISLPMDISPAGLRKFKKNATLMMSDMLCGKVKRIRKLTFGDLVLSVLPWPFHKDLPDPGTTGPCTDKDKEARMYCSLSIPIVTLAALILMIIIVSLFDMFFRWIPYLFTCFPIPGMKGKKA